MRKYNRQELEDAFDYYQATALKAGTSGDWNPWADLDVDLGLETLEHPERFPLRSR